MLASVKNIANSALAFLSSTSAPPNTPLVFREAMKRENHFASKKFFVAFTSFIGLAIFYFGSIGVLFFLPYDKAEVITGFVTIFTKTIEILAIIIGAYLGLQTAVDMKYASSSSLENTVSTSIEDVEEKVIQQQTIKYAELYKDDPSYAPIEWIEKYDN